MTNTCPNANLIQSLRRFAIGQDVEGKNILADFLRKAADRLEALTPAPPPENSVEVRICVSVNTSGGVYCWEIGHEPEDTDDPWITHRAIVTASIPHERIPVITGTVE
jgi:hypothetical protein